MDASNLKDMIDVKGKKDVRLKARLLLEIEGVGRDMEDLISRTVERLSPLDKYQFAVLDALARAHRQDIEEVPTMEVSSYGYYNVDARRIIPKMLKSKDHHLVVGRRDPEDNRYKLIRLTTEGKRLHQAIMGALEEAARLEFLTWTDSELDQLEYLISRIRQQRAADQR